MLSALHLGLARVWLASCRSGYRAARTGGPALPRAEITGCAADLEGPSLGLPRHERRGGLEHVLRELTLAGQQLLGEVIGVRHHFLWLGQLVRERRVHGGQLRRDRLDSVCPGLDRVKHCFLALLDGLEDVVLHLLSGGTGAVHRLFLLWSPFPSC